MPQLLDHSLVLAGFQPLLCASGARGKKASWWLLPTCLYLPSGFCVGWLGAKGAHITTALVFLRWNKARFHVHGIVFSTSVWADHQFKDKAPRQHQVNQLQWQCQLRRTSRVGLTCSQRKLLACQLLSEAEQLGVQTQHGDVDQGEEVTYHYLYQGLLVIEVDQPGLHVAVGENER